ncbi:MAG: hypothetical protein R3F33_16590 [Planctomycetota bacterium]
MSDGAREMPRIRVQQSDGGLRVLDEERLCEDLLRAVERSGDGDLVVCREVIAVVRLAAASRLMRRMAAGEAEPFLETGALGSLVEQALVEMGRAPLAKAYILQRDARHRARAAVAFDPAEPGPGGNLPVVRDGSGATPWDQARIAAALVREAELPQEIAQEVARRVQRRVFDAGLRRLTSSLVRAFVDNELGAMGLEEALARQKPVGIPRHDLREALDHVDPTRLGPRLGGEVLRRFALEDVLGPESALWHQGGDLSVEDLGAPQCPLSLALPAELLIRGAVSARTPFELLDGLAPLLAWPSQSLVLEDLEPAFAALGRGGKAERALEQFLLSASALGRATGRELELASPGGRGGRWTAGLLAAQARLLQAGHTPPRLWLDGAQLAAALARDGELAGPVDELLAAGRLAAVWGGESAAAERQVGPGLRRKGRERGAVACGGAVALNLPRLAREAGSWREERFLEGLVQALRRAVQAISELATFQAGFEPARGWARPRLQYAVAPIGLWEALRILGDGELRADQGARILGFLAEAIVRFGREQHLAIHLDGSLGLAATGRLARLDQRRGGDEQPRLFEDLPMPEGETLSRRYAAGLLPPAALRASLGTSLDDAAAFLDRLLVGVRCGALLASGERESGRLGAASGPAGGQGPWRGPQLALWDRFTALRKQNWTPDPETEAQPTPSQAAPDALERTLFD